MSVPINVEKELDDWKFEDLVKWACWEVVQSMYNGKTLHSTMHYILEVTRRWNPKKKSNDY